MATWVYVLAALFGFLDRDRKATAVYMAIFLAIYGCLAISEIWESMHLMYGDRANFAGAIINGIVGTVAAGVVSAAVYFACYGVRRILAKLLELDQRQP